MNNVEPVTVINSIVNLNKMIEITKRGVRL